MSDDLTSSEDQDWVDEILSRALARAEGTDPTSVAGDASAPLRPPDHTPPTASVRPSPAPAQPEPGAPPGSTNGAGAPTPTAPPAEQVPVTRPATERPAVPIAASAAVPAVNDSAPDSRQAPASDARPDIAHDDGLTSYGRPSAHDDLLFDEPSVEIDENLDWGDSDDSDPVAVSGPAADFGTGGGGGDTGFLFGPDDEEDASGSSLRGILEWGAVILGALTVALLIKTFLMQAYFIPSSSMEPTLDIGDRILVNKVSYDLHDVNRGDLVVFERPPTQRTGEDDLIKRVIALGGETIRIEDNQVFIDNRLLQESYVTPEQRTEPRFGNVDNCSATTANSCTVAEGHVFVMGDNRLQSADSRVFGPISEDLIIGRAFLRVWPLGDIKAL